MKNFTTISVFILFFSCMANHANAQQRFKAGLVFGLNAAQITGDDSAGYNKLGLHGGLRAITVLRDKMDIVLELLYSQRGSYAQFAIEDMKINLQYVEVPIMFSYKDWYKEEDDYYKVQLTGGLSYGRLLNATAIGSKHDFEVQNFHDNDYSFTIGADVFLSKHFAIGGRWTRSINLLWNNKHEKSLDSLFGYFLSFRGMYVF